MVDVNLEPLFILNPLGYRSSSKHLPYSSNIDLVISIDQSSMINYWSPSNPNKIPITSFISIEIRHRSIRIDETKIECHHNRIFIRGSSFCSSLLTKSSEEKKLFVFDCLKDKIWKIFNEQISLFFQVFFYIFLYDCVCVHFSSLRSDEHLRKKMISSPIYYPSMNLFFYNSKNIQSFSMKIFIKLLVQRQSLKVISTIGSYSHTHFTFSIVLFDLIDQEDSDRECKEVKSNDKDIKYIDSYFIVNSNSTDACPSLT